VDFSFFAHDLFLVGGEWKHFNANGAPEKWPETSRVKTPKLKLPVAPESGHNST
jgi:hypothetical protein